MNLGDDGGVGEKSDLEPVLPPQFPASEENATCLIGLGRSNN